jgi:hypothetical protein
MKPKPAERRTPTPTPPLAGGIDLDSLRRQVQDISSLAIDVSKRTDRATKELQAFESTIPAIRSELDTVHQRINDHIADLERARRIGAEEDRLAADTERAIATLTADIDILASPDAKSDLIRALSALKTAAVGKDSKALVLTPDGQTELLLLLFPSAYADHTSKGSGILIPVQDACWALSSVAGTLAYIARAFEEANRLVPLLNLPEEVRKTLRGLQDQLNARYSFEMNSSHAMAPFWYCVSQTIESVASIYKAQMLREVGRGRHREEIAENLVRVVCERMALAEDALRSPAYQNVRHHSAPPSFQRDDLRRMQISLAGAMSEVLLGSEHDREAAFDYLKAMQEQLNNNQLRASALLGGLRPILGNERAEVACRAKDHGKFLATAALGSAYRQYWRVSA